ncbi:MAG: hypothetical protein EAX96_10275 [Candidatus Lokiarchaeota archaeon]|nr:hypothetical protein [Candidatus Lokiarchaeota archaeon]
MLEEFNKRGTKVSLEFQKFADTIIRRTRLEVEGGIMDIAFLEYITEFKTVLWNFEEKAKKLFTSWKEKGGGFFSDVGDFFIKQGPDLFRIWLTEIFPFSSKHIIINCSKHSAVDSQVKINYYYQKNEIEALRNIMTVQNIINFDLKDAAAKLLVNAIKIISKSFTAIIEMEYKIFTSRLDVLDANDVIIVDFFGAGRVRK